MHLPKAILYCYINYDVAGLLSEDLFYLCVNQYSSDMKILILSIIAAAATAAPGGFPADAVVSGPSGVVTAHGAIGPAALGIGPYGAGHGAGAYGAGVYGAAPAVSHASVVGPAAGYGAYGGLAGHSGPGPDDGYAAYDGSYGGYAAGLGGHAGGYGGYGGGLGLAHGVTVTNGGGTIGVSPHGVAVRGPPTVPATIAGPAGKVVAEGLYGVPTHGHGW
ncbi:unnamed protein product [Phaedon cochleariae]|uniref:Uncharacterized protein n=1 Tax=Phaedon cochleariae TaxID=80249 RepID=A0A9P0DPU5_PHACE|nr:unnamed protein product [Phaedon cochleariae]